MQTTAVRKTAPILTLVMWLLIVSPLRAQEDVSPLIRLLERIPDHSAIAESFSYVDYRAVINARPGAPLVTTAEEWQTLVDSEAEALGVWTAAFNGVASGSQDILMSLREPLSTRDVTGIDPFSIERVVVYGEPPGEVVLLEGDFDTEAIAAAHAVRDYQELTVDGITLWCGSADCDGSFMDLSSREPADPFGGRLGRRQPLFVTNSLVASSPSTPRLVTQAQASEGDATTLAQNTDYSSLAEAITQERQLLQAWFISPLDIAPVSATLVTAMMGAEISADQIAALQAAMEDEFTPLPQYRLVALGDTATENEQIALVALVYSNSDRASTAGEILVQRIEDYVSLATRQPMSELLDARGVTAIDTEIYETDERAVLLVMLHAPIPAAEPNGEGLAPVSSSMLFQLLLNMYFQRDLGWLATTF
jgi:hypothetical protein